MSTVRVRALTRGFDGSARREPGDEFDYDIKLKGNGSWFEVIDGEGGDELVTINDTLSMDNTKDEIMAFLEERDIEFDASETKADLLALLDESLA